MSRNRDQATWEGLETRIDRKVLEPLREIRQDLDEVKKLALSVDEKLTRTTNGKSVLERLRALEDGMRSIRDALKELKDSARGRGLILDNIDRKLPTAGSRLNLDLWSPKGAVAGVLALLSLTGAFFGGRTTGPSAELPPETVTLLEEAKKALEDWKTAVGTEVESAQPVQQRPVKPARRSPGKPAPPGGRGSTMRTARVTTEVELAALRQMLAPDHADGIHRWTRQEIP